MSAASAEIMARQIMEIAHVVRSRNGRKVIRLCEHVFFTSWLPAEALHDVVRYYMAAGQEGIGLPKNAVITRPKLIHPVTAVILGCEDIRTAFLLKRDNEVRSTRLAEIRVAINALNKPDPRELAVIELIFKDVENT